MEIVVNWDANDTNLNYSKVKMEKKNSVLTQYNSWNVKYFSQSFFWLHDNQKVFIEWI